MRKSVLSAISGLAVVAGGFALLPASANAQPGRGPSIPSGSYTRSCEDMRMNGGRLYAVCRDMRGQMRASTLEISRCGRSDVVNRDGLLMCGNIAGQPDRNYRPGQPNRPGQPPIPNRPGFDNRGGSITLYRDSNYRGQELRFDGEVSNLRNVGMNDAVSSIRLSRGSGDWQVCTDANFRGRCEIISTDVSDLTRMRLNDQISSIRPIDRRHPGRR
ncbi:beta/gamma crystallin-related protein [uncultured Brevundimonas sp.]|uniref:beta/gamma crystallin-related protein n=1 Tax=uncultured Brevundimonas sp. TaxID=213418 RepID=UPI0026211729|nr:beta/gamma crystallin-related protein [uncultured Brevundimonas sp.]